MVDIVKENADIKVDEYIKKYKKARKSNQRELERFARIQNYIWSQILDKILDIEMPEKTFTQPKKINKKKIIVVGIIVWILLSGICYIITTHILENRVATCVENMDCCLVWNFVEGNEIYNDTILDVYKGRAYLWNTNKTKLGEECELVK